MKIPFLALILQGIPEAVAIVTLSFIIAKIPLQWKKLVFIGVVIALTSYVLRMFPVTFGIHTVIIMGLQFLLLVRIGKGNINSCLVAALISSLSIIILETVSLSLLMPVFGVTSEMLFTNTTVRVLITLPQVFVMFLIAFIVYKIKNRQEVK